MSSARKKVTTACLACRKRKTRCDGLQPSCRTCQTYNSQCVYNLEQDSRKTPNKSFISALRGRAAALEETLNNILDAETIEAREDAIEKARQQRNRDGNASTQIAGGVSMQGNRQENPTQGREEADEDDEETDTGEADAIRDMTSMLEVLDVDETGTVYSVGASANVVRMRASPENLGRADTGKMEQMLEEAYIPFNHTCLSPLNLECLVNPVYLTPLEHHLLRLYFVWQHPIAHLFSEDRFRRDLALGYGSCYSPLLLAVLLSIGSSYSRYANEEQGDMYFARAKKLLSDELERPSLPTCQALVLMGAREAGCGRERGSGWLYAGMGFRMQSALGTDKDLKKVDKNGYLTIEDIEERAFTFWGSFVHDRGWTAYLGRSDSLPFRDPDRDIRMPDRGPALPTWCSYTDDDFTANNIQHFESTTPSYHIGSFKHLCQLVGLLGSVVRNLYDKGNTSDTKLGLQSDAVTDLYVKLCSWHTGLPPYMRLNSSSPPIAIIAHMFHHAARILLFRPFIRARHGRRPIDDKVIAVYDISPRAICNISAFAIVKCLRQYQKVYTLRRYSNWMVHAVLTAATIFVVNATATSSASAPSELVAEAFCTADEAASRLGEIVSALNEMGAAWANARRCSLQIQQWITRYNIRTKGFNSVVQSDFAHYRQPVTNAAQIPHQAPLSRLASPSQFPAEQLDLLGMDLFPQHLYSGWQQDFTDYS